MAWLKQAAVFMNAVQRAYVKRRANEHCGVAAQLANN